jgi:hypothetical protein
LSVKGKVTQVNDRSVTVEERLTDESTYLWQVNVNDQTEMIKHIKRSIEEVRKARAAGERLRPYVEEQATFSDFEVGQDLTISASGNIAGQEEFTAKKVIITIESS